MECPEAASSISEGDEVEVDFDTGIIKNITTGEEFKSAPFPGFIKEIIDADGLVDYIKPGNKRIGL